MKMFSLSLGPIKQHTDVENLILKLKNRSIAKAFNSHTLDRKGAATHIKRRSSKSQHAQAIIEELFDLDYFATNFKREQSH